jgi:hypothetical protein
MLELVILHEPFPSAWVLIRKTRMAKWLVNVTFKQMMWDYDGKSTFRLTRYPGLICSTNLTVQP